MASSIETLAQGFPSLAIDAAQISGAGGMAAGGHSGHQACLAAQHHSRRGGLAASGPALVVALRAELVLEIVVGARQIRDGVAVEQARSVIAGDFAEVPDSLARV